MTDKTQVTDPRTSTPAPLGLFEGPPFETLRKEINRLFEDFPFSRALQPFDPFDMAGFAPHLPVDFVDRGSEYEISAELPGLDEKNVDVTIAGGVLSISGEKRDEKTQDREGRHLTERRYGSFRRTFALPADVDPDKIAAYFDKGVLKVTLPKGQPPQKQEKKIPVGKPQ